MRILPNAERGRLARDGIEIMDSLGTGGWSEHDVAVVVDPADAVRGLAEYANYLEALLVVRGLDVAAIRQSARAAADALATR